MERTFERVADKGGAYLRLTAGQRIAGARQIFLTAKGLAACSPASAEPDSGPVWEAAARVRDSVADVRELPRPAYMTPTEWRDRQAAELRAMVRRNLLHGAPDPFAGHVGL